MSRLAPRGEWVLRGEFVGGPVDGSRPTLTILAWESWPYEVTFHGQGPEGRICLFRYTHRGNGRYDVAQAVAATPPPPAAFTVTEPPPVDPVTEGRPALAWMFGKGRSTAPGSSWPFVGPDGECAGCPFGTPTCERDPFEEPPNSADPGEGRYDCSLLGREAIWGEGPPCTEDDWTRRARAELESAVAGDASPRERAVRHLRRALAGVRAMEWPLVAADLDQLITTLAGRAHDDVAAKVWNAIMEED